MSQENCQPAPRISGRLGEPIDLNITFYKNGVPTDPFAVRRISIYRSAVTRENLIVQIPIVNPCDPVSAGSGNEYPFPLTREEDHHHHILPGVFHYIWDVPCTGIAVPDIFFDVWEYVIACPPGEGSEPHCYRHEEHEHPCCPEHEHHEHHEHEHEEHHSEGHEHHHHHGSECTPSSGSEIICSPEVQHIMNDECFWQKSCNEFWLYPDGFTTDTGLETIRLGFEAIDVHMYQPEKRTIEVGMMPLPLYDFDYNKIAPIIPRLRATFTLSTENNEILIDNEYMRIGLRQGTYRSDPFVLQYTLDSKRLLKGTYKYRCTLLLPNGESRASPDFYLQVS